MTDGVLIAATPMPELSAELIALSARSDDALAAALPDATQPPTELHRAMRYSVLDAMVDAATGHVLSGSRTTPEEVVEVWVFV